MSENRTNLPTVELVLTPDEVIVSFRFPIRNLIPVWLYRILQHFRIGTPVYTLPVIRSETAGIKEVV